MGVATMSSRILGMVRESVYATFMGDGWVAGAFTLAFMVPNLFRRLLGEGVLTAAFIPLFKEKEKQETEPAMWHAANAVLSGLTAAASAIVALGMLVITILLHARASPVALRETMTLLQTAFPWVVALCLAAGAMAWVPARGLWGRGASLIIGTAGAAALLWVLGLAGISLELCLDIRDGPTLLMLELLRVMFPYVLLVCIAAVFMAMLNARGHFFVPAMGATMLNVVMIASVLWLAPRMGEGLEKQIFGLAIGVVIAGFAQTAFQMPLLRREGFRLRWVTPWRDETVRKVVAKMIPGTVGVAAFQLNVLITIGFAYSIDPSVVASFNYAVRLMELPQGVFGVSLATYLLPTLAGLAAEKKYPEFRTTLRHGMSWLIFANLLASVLLFLLAEPIVRLLFERGRFDEFSTNRAALALACLAPGLLAFSLVNILARAFYALGDTRTPMLISIFCLALNAIFALALIWHFKQAGLAVANTASALVNMSLLFYALRRKLKTIGLMELWRQIPALLGAAVLAGATAWMVLGWWNRQFGHEVLWQRLGEVFLPMTAATLVYVGLCAWLKTGHTDELFAAIRSRLRR